MLSGSMALIRNEATMQQVKTRARTKHSSRRAAATLELAVCLPVIVTIVLGTIEAANSIFLKPSLTIAAYESARVASAPSGTYDGAVKRAKELMYAKGLRKFDISISPKQIDKAQSGKEVVVTVTTYANANSISPSWYDKRAKMSATMRMIRL
jgi:hypothetical protein